MELGFAEHGPMIAEAISTLGRDDAVGPWGDSYKANYRHLPPSPRTDAINPANKEDWRVALGAAFDRQIHRQIYRRAHPWPHPHCACGAGHLGERRAPG